jgi:hypothetical protein
MSTRSKIALLIFFGVLLAAPVQAAQLFPLQTGRWTEADKQDNLDSKWVVRADILEEVTLDNTKYFHARVLNYDPPEGDVSRDMYIRSTETEIYFWNGPGLGETLGFKLGEVGISWTYNGGANKKEIVAIEQITIPYGGNYTAYKYQSYAISNPSAYNLEWVVPGLGLAKEEDHWVDNPARIPIISLLTRAGMKVNPAFMLLLLE